MKFYIKLLKDWADPNGKVWAKGQTICLDDRETAMSLLLDDIGEKAEAPADTKDGGTDDGGIIEFKGLEEQVSKSVEAAVDAKMDEIGQKAAEHVHEIQVKDLDDLNPTHGYLDYRDGQKYAPDELKYGIGLFAADVHAAGSGFSNPSERLKKSLTRSREVIEKGLQRSDIKAAGDGLQAQVDEEAGALIPPAFNTMLLNTAAEVAQVRPRASTIPIGGMAVILPKVSDYNRSTGIVHGGLIAYWKGEDEQLTEVKTKLEDIQLNLHALTILAYASHQALRFSAVDLGGFLVPKMADAITFKEEDAFINGTGAGMPLGVLNAPGKLSITAESGQTSTANIIVIENIDKMEGRVRVVRPGSTVWMYNRPELFSWLRDLKRTVGTGGEIDRLFRFGGFGGGSTSNLDGIPILDNEHIPAAATNGDLSLIDWSQYLIADDRRGPESAQSMHLKFDYAQTAWRIIKYVDAQPMDSAVYTRHKGSNTTSSIVTIATRS